MLSIASAVGANRAPVTDSPWSPRFKDRNLEFQSQFSGE
jgi:hypothetical protein